MEYLPKIDGFHSSGEKQIETAIFVCSSCLSRRTVKTGKTIPKCSKCQKPTYWYKI